MAKIILVKTFQIRFYSLVEKITLTILSIAYFELLRL